MRKTLLAILCCGLLFAGVVEAGKGERSAQPHRYIAQSLDRDLVQAETADGRIWSAWSYRNGGEYDLAISMQDVDGTWTEPLFFGNSDGRDQLQPALAVDPRGATYVAFADDAQRLYVAAVQPGSNEWSTLVRVANGDQLASPSLMIVGDQLIVGYRNGDAVDLVALPLLPAPGAGIESIYDGPDPTTGDSQDDEDDKEEEEHDITSFGDEGQVIPVAQGHSSRRNGSDR